MNQIVEFSFGKGEVAHVTLEQRESGMVDEMRALPGECFGASRENRGMGIEAELPIDVKKALDEPAAEETGTPGDENALPTHFFPKRLRLPENMVEIRNRYGLRAH